MSREIESRTESNMTDDEFLDSFQSCQLPMEQWTHRAHVRVAFLYASTHDYDVALDRMRSSIKRYNQATATPESVHRGYHETITQSFMRLVYVAQLQRGPFESADAFCDAHPDLLSKHVLNDYYSKDHLMSLDAKTRFVDPDRSPLPQILDGGITIMNVRSGWALPLADRMFREYADSLDFDLCFQDFETELKALPGRYQAPSGCLLLAFRNNQPAGCVALRPLDANTCEMKRLWVEPSFRRQGFGRLLAQAVVKRAQKIGYNQMRLDTINTMTTAIRLYHSLGFREIEAYTINPIEGAVYMEATL